MFGLPSKESIQSAHQSSSLKVPRAACNVRGVFRNREFMIAAVTPAQQYMSPTKNALKLADVSAVCGPFKEGILLCAEHQIVSDPIQNLGVRYHVSGEVLCPYSVCLRVQGTKKTQLLSMNHNASSRVLVSENVKCISPLTVGETAYSARRFKLRSFCGEDELLDLKLDATAAFVWVSNVIAPAAPEEPVTYIVDYMERVESGDIAKASEFMTGMLQLCTRARGPVDVSQAVQWTTPENAKRARVLEKYPSDTGVPGN